MSSTLTSPRPDGVPPAPVYDLFIIHADADRAWVEGYLKPILGLEPGRVITPGNFKLGVATTKEFDRAVTSSRFSVLVLSPAFLADPWSEFGEQLASHTSVEEKRGRMVALDAPPVPAAAAAPVPRRPGLHRLDAVGRAGRSAPGGARSARAGDRGPHLPVSGDGPVPQGGRPVLPRPRRRDPEPLDARPPAPLPAGDRAVGLGQVVAGHGRVPAEAGRPEELPPRHLARAHDAPGATPLDELARSFGGAVDDPGRRDRRGARRRAPGADDCCWSSTSSRSSSARSRRSRRATPSSAA